MTVLAPSTFAESLDPRTKMGATLLLSIITLLQGPPAKLTVLLGAVLLFAISGRIRLTRLLRRTMTVGAFLAVIILTSLFTVGGEVLFEILGVYATLEGLSLGIEYSARIVILVWLASLFVWTTPTEQLLDGIASLLRRLPGSGIVVLLVGIVLTMVPVFIRTTRRVKLAQTARGAAPGGSLFQQLRFATSAALPLFAGIIRSADDLSLAIEARCFDPYRRRSQYGSVSMTSRDWIVLLGIVLLSTLLLIVQFTPDLIP